MNHPGNPTDNPIAAPLADRDRLTRETLHDQIVARLRDLIARGELTPGSRIPERELCERFDVSRTPLREAFKVLAWEGLLELNPNRGARVTAVSYRTVEEVMPVLAALAAPLGELACRHITHEQMAAVRAWYRQLLIHSQRPESSQYARCRQALDDAILKAARNPTLYRTFRCLSNRLGRAFYATAHVPTPGSPVIREYERIIRALEARDGEALVRLLRGQLLRQLNSASERLRGREQTEAAAGA